MNNKLFYIESFGCQMNVADSQIVASILITEGYKQTKDLSSSDIIMLNTCSIRANAENKIFTRLQNLKKYAFEGTKIGILGCMAQKEKNKIFANSNNFVDFIVGPDSYRELPRILGEVNNGDSILKTILSKKETYNDILPVRLATNKISAFVSIMRGCNNMCSYCVVPFTRGRERSRNLNSIIKEIEELEKQNYKEITVLGQNVNSYLVESENGKINFAKFLQIIANKFPKLLIRFTTSHPKDFDKNLIDIIANTDNIAKHVHLPLQSGSNNMLKKMNRAYTVEQYMEIIKMLKKKITNISITTDIIAGFCGETEEDHKQTIKIMKEVKYDYAYSFKYSEREKTYAYRNLKNNVEENVKSKRLTEIIELQQKLSNEQNNKDIDKIFTIIIEGKAKKDENQLFGRNSQNKVIVFEKENAKIGEKRKVKILRNTSATLIGKLI